LLLLLGISSFYREYLNPHQTSLVNSVRSLIYNAGFVSVQEVIDEACRGLDSVARDLEKLIPRFDAELPLVVMRDQGVNLMNGILVHLLRKSRLALLGLGFVAQLLGVVLNSLLVNQSAEQLTRSFRNELLAGNSMYAIKQLNPYMGERFLRVDFRESEQLVFTLPESEKSEGRSWISELMKSGEGLITMPICFDTIAQNCGTSLEFTYHRWRLGLPIALGTLVLLLIYLGMFYILRQRIVVFPVLAQLTKVT
jgi:hypothetical protein